MTIEEKAKAYDKALKDIRAIYPNLKGDTKLAVEHAFSELNESDSKESDDEKMRKAALEGIEYLEHELCWDAIGDIDILDVKEYLEKQKEQKPKMIQWTGKNLKEVIDFTGKFPRFDEWFKSWEEYKNYVHSHNNILKLFCEDGSHYEVPVGSWIVKTPDGFNIPSLFKFVQKPVEYIEFDNEFKNQISHLLASVLNKEHDYTEGFVKYVSQSLLEYAKNELKSAEWNEEYREEDLRTRFAFYTYKNEEDDGILYLSNVFVEETSRNKGFGTKILQAAEKVAETIGAITIRLKVKQNSPTNAWYRKHGYGYLTFEDEYDWLEKKLGIS